MPSLGLRYQRFSLEVATLKGGRSRVDLSVAGISDPDGDTLTYQWFCYNKVGTFTTACARINFMIANADKSEAWFTVPNRRILRTGTRHLIVAVTDFGTPALARYQRVIVTVTP